MRAAPPVDAALSAGGLERMLITLLHALSGAVLATWLALHAELRPAGQVLMLVLGAAGMLAALGAWLARQALPAPPGRLRWDGQAWCHVGAHDVPLCRLVVALDLGLWALLRLHPADGGRAVWRVASAGGAQAAWHGLRVALAAHAGAAVQGAGEARP